MWLYRLDKHTVLRASLFRGCPNNCLLEKERLHYEFKSTFRPFLGRQTVLGGYRSALKLQPEHLDLACREFNLGVGMAPDDSQSECLSLRGRREFFPHKGTEGMYCAGQNLANCDVEIINKYIGASFEAMKEFGPQVFRPFMQVCSRPWRFSLHAMVVWQDGYLHAALL